MENIAICSYKRKHIERNSYLTRPRHPETEQRMEQHGLTPEAMQLANQRRHWLAYLRIHRAQDRLIKERKKNPDLPQKLSLRAIAREARAAFRTVREALKYPLAFICFQVRQALSTNPIDLSKNRDQSSKLEQNRKRAEQDSREFWQTLPQSRGFIKPPESQKSVLMTAKDRAALFCRALNPTGWGLRKKVLEKRISWSGQRSKKMPKEKITEPKRRYPVCQQVTPLPLTPEEREKRIQFAEQAKQLQLKKNQEALAKGIKMILGESLSQYLE